jgi:hypothetical protein
MVDANVSMIDLSLSLVECGAETRCKEQYSGHKPSLHNSFLISLDEVVVEGIQVVDRTVST